MKIYEKMASRCGKVSEIPSFSLPGFGKAYNNCLQHSVEIIADFVKSMVITSEKE